MTLEELTPWLFERTTGGIRWGLETTRELLAGVGDPHRSFVSLHIGGTNGKGSVAALCDAALRHGSSRRTVGLYTSPHLVSFTERIRIGGRPVSDEALLGAADALRPAIERTGASFFEATTAIAFLCFARAGVHIAVVEVGLGGRLDATNVIDPLVVGITNVALDHTEYLGDSLEEVAREKAGIFKRDVPAITSEADPNVLEVLTSAAAAAGAPLRELDDLARIEHVTTSASGTRFHLESRAWGGREVAIPLPGVHQAGNAALAAELIAELPRELRPEWEGLASGFAGVRWPGRLQLHRIRSTTWLFDVAHNPAGVATLAASLGELELPRPIVLVAGILADKPWREILDALLPRTDAAILTIPASAPASRRWDPEEASEWARAAGHPRPRVIPELTAAVARAETLAPHGTVLVAGSVHTVGDAMAALRVEVG